MTIAQLLPLISGQAQGTIKDPARAVSSGYACDLLSWVMAKGKADMAWVTVQTHLNVVAVAALHDMACVILPEAIKMEEAPLQKAQEEGITVISSPLTAYDICARLSGAGLPA